MVLLPACAISLAGCQTDIVSDRQQETTSLDQPVNWDPAAARPYQDSGFIHAAPGRLQESVKDFGEATVIVPRIGRV